MGFLSMMNGHGWKNEYNNPKPKKVKVQKNAKDRPIKPLKGKGGKKNG